MQVEEIFIWGRKRMRNRRIRYSMTIANSPLVAQPIKMQDLHQITSWVILISERVLLYCLQYGPFRQHYTFSSTTTFLPFKNNLAGLLKYFSPVRILTAVQQYVALAASSFTFVMTKSPDGIRVYLPPNVITLSPLCHDMTRT